MDADKTPQEWLDELLAQDATLDELRAAAQHCQACPLWQRGTQTVFGDGPHARGEAGPRAVLVGEQPGDEEDRSGRPFVGPAGRLLDAALHEAGIERADVYVTNAVKHFKWQPRGKRRLHERPSAGEVRACRPWLEAELAWLAPRVVVCLGATAAHALLGPQFQLSRERGQPRPAAFAAHALATVHPSYLLRLRDPLARRDDLRCAACLLR